MANNKYSISISFRRIESALGRIGSKIGWGTLQTDTSPPELVEITPSLTKTSGVSILSNIIIRIQDPLPAAGIDLTTLNMTINGFPVISGGSSVEGTNELRGSAFDHTIIHRPKRVFN